MTDVREKLVRCKLCRGFFHIFIPIKIISTWDYILDLPKEVTTDLIDSKKAEKEFLCSKCKGQTLLGFGLHE